MAAADPPSGALARLGREIRRRNVLPWTLGYLAGAWVVLESTDYFGDLYGWPGVVDRVLPVILAFGILSTIVLAWFHGVAGWQRMRGREIAIHAGIAALLLTTLGVWDGTAPGSPPDEPLPLTRIAVLYFKNRTPAQTGDRSGDLTEAVVHRLANVPALDVLPLTPVERYRNEEMPPFEDLIEELRAGTFVEGSVTTVADSVLVTAQLVESETGRHLDSWELAAADDGVGGWLPPIADAVADSVRSCLGDVLAWRHATAGATVPEAVEAYRRALTIREDEAAVTWKEDHRAGVDLLEQADALLREAERMDPSWPAPVELRSEIAELAARLEGGVGGIEPTRMRTAIAHATRALEMGQDSARMLARRGELLFQLAGRSERPEAARLYQEAERDLRLAVRLDPDRADAWWTLSRILERRGAFEGAYEYAKRAQKADSFLELGPDAPYRLLMTSLQGEHVEEARHWCRRGRELYPSDQSLIQGCMFVLVSLPDPDEDDIATAWELVRALGSGQIGMAERRPGWEAWGELATATILAQQGRADSAEHVIRRARAQIEGRSLRLRAAAEVFEALARYRLGQTDAALEDLRKYVDLVPAEAPRLASEWWFRGLWDHPEYRALHTTKPTEAAGGR